jgi:hypothetical protein
MRRAVEVTEGRRLELLLYFDLNPIQTSPCSVHVEQDIKNKAHPMCLQCSSTSGNKDDRACLYCNELYSVSTEIWVACGHCGKWAHKSCAKEEEEDVTSVYICSSCTKTIK